MWGQIEVQEGGKAGGKYIRKKSSRDKDYSILIVGTNLIKIVREVSRFVYRKNCKEMSIKLEDYLLKKK